MVVESHLDKVVPDLVASPPEFQASLRQDEVTALKAALGGPGRRKYRP